jgi:hypothetical protein
MTPENRKELMLGTSILAVIVVAAISIPIAIKRFDDRIHAPKYAMQTGDLIINYMSANHGQWPTDWEDLGRYVPKDAGAWFAEVRKNVDIDFDWDPKSVDISIDRHVGSVPIGPVSLKSGEILNHESYPDPDVIIFDYIKRAAGAVGSR